MKQHNEVALISSGQQTVSANGLRLSIVTGIIEKHWISRECRGNIETDGKNTWRDLVFWITGAISDYGPDAVVMC